MHFQRASVIWVNQYTSFSEDREFAKHFAEYGDNKGKLVTVLPGAEAINYWKWYLSEIKDHPEHFGSESDIKHTIGVLTREKEWVFPFASYEVVDRDKLVFRMR